MKKMLIILAAVAILVLVAYQSFSLNEQPKKRIITIGSGSESAMFYPVAVSLCKIFNEYNQDPLFICRAVISDGAEYNLEAVETNQFDIGIVQATLQFDAYNGAGKYNGKAHKNLRTLFNIHDEYLTIIARKDSNISSFADLRGKKVNIGNVGSGSRVLFSQMIESIGWKMTDFKEVYEESGSNIYKVLCSPKKAEAAIYIVGHPNQSFAKMINDCDAKLISLSDSEIEKFVELSPIEFHKSFIPENTYEKSREKVNTFASKTILTASAKLDKKFVQTFVKIISEHKDELVKMQPSLSVIDILSKDDPNLAPLHEGLKVE